MTPVRPRVGGFLPMKSAPRQPDAAADGDFSWPPPADDVAGCSIVMLQGGDYDVWTRTPVLAAGPDEAFPDVDVETALAEFADLPTTPRVRQTAAPAPSRSPQGAPPSGSPSGSWWKAGPTRTAVALSVGAALVLLPSPGLSSVSEAQPLAAPAQARPRQTMPRRTPIRRSEVQLRPAADRVRVAPEPVAEWRQMTPVLRDEDYIRTTLMQLQTAYAQLDADAAREVWPSVDVDALTRAFQGLRWQELRFDHCDVTVRGARARAACTGEAVYVPRDGRPASSSDAREWTFELTRARERWMIASARAS